MPSQVKPTRLVIYHPYLPYIERTRIVQVSAGHASDAPLLLTQSRANEQPIIVMVKRSYCCCCCDLKFDIPAGLTTLEESCGRSTGIMLPGAQWCYCCHKRVACMLTQAIVNYNAPVRLTIDRYIIGSQLSYQG